jgi:hypothetical protein
VKCLSMIEFVKEKEKLEQRSVNMRNLAKQQQD